MAAHCTDIRHNGLDWVAEFSDGGRSFCMNRQNLEARIANLKAGGYALGDEEAALVELKKREQRDG